MIPLIIFICGFSFYVNFACDVNIDELQIFVIIKIHVLVIDYNN